MKITGQFKRAPGRPKNPPSDRRNVVLSEAASGCADELMEEFADHWGIPTTFSALVARALEFATNEVVAMPPEYERLRVVQAHLRKLKADWQETRAGDRSTLFRFYGEVTLKQHEALALRQALHDRTRQCPQLNELARWPAALAAASQVAHELNELGNAANLALSAASPYQPASTIRSTAPETVLSPYRRR